MVHYLLHGVVRLDGMGKFTLQGWLTNTRHAIRILRASIGQPATQAAQWALQWLRACGVTTREQVDALEHRLALLEQAPDPSRIIRCCRCTRPLSDPLSKALAIGPECRKVLGRARRDSRRAWAWHAAQEEAMVRDEYAKKVAP